MAKRTQGPYPFSKEWSDQKKQKQAAYLDSLEADKEKRHERAMREWERQIERDKKATEAARVKAIREAEEKAATEYNPWRGKRLAAVIEAYAETIKPIIDAETKDILKSNYVYIIGERWRIKNKGIIKIGRSANPKKRLHNIITNTGNSKLCILYTFRCDEYAELLEKKVHKVLAHRRIGKAGERFRISKQEAINTIALEFEKLHYSKPTIVPRLKGIRRENKYIEFLAAYRKTRSINKACKQLGISRASIDRELANYPDFKYLFLWVRSTLKKTIVEEEYY